jgi:hypothetical protein
MFGDSDYEPAAAYDGHVPLEEQLEALARAVEAGKVRRAPVTTPGGLTLFDASSHHHCTP